MELFILTDHPIFVSILRIHLRASNEFIYFQTKFYIILQVFYTESVYILKKQRTFRKFSSNSHQFDDVFNSKPQIKMQTLSVYKTSNMR